MHMQEATNGALLTMSYVIKVYTDIQQGPEGSLF